MSNPVSEWLIACAEIMGWMQSITVTRQEDPAEDYDETWRIRAFIEIPEELHALLLDPETSDDVLEFTHQQLIEAAGMHRPWFSRPGQMFASEPRVNVLKGEPIVRVAQYGGWDV